MEFKLNKIDTDIRRRMQEQTKEDKVHSSKSINANKDLVKEKGQLDEEEQKQKKNKHYAKKNNKKYITVDGIKYNDHEVRVEVEKLEALNEGNSKGRILDEKK